jgi:hypothetical protein
MPKQVVASRIYGGTSRANQPRRNDIKMMPIGVPKVAYRVPGSQSADWCVAWKDCLAGWHATVFSQHTLTVNLLSPWLPLAITPASGAFVVTKYHAFHPICSRLCRLTFS